MSCRNESPPAPTSNAYRQEPNGAGFKVFLGDLVRRKEFIFEITTPVPLSGDKLLISARATYRDDHDAEVQVVTATNVMVFSSGQVEQYPIDKKVVAKVLAQLPALAEMESVAALEAGDFDEASRSVSAGRAAYERALETYLAAGAIPETAALEAMLDELDARTTARSFSPSDLKRRYGASRRASRSRPTDPDADVK